VAGSPRPHRSHAQIVGPQAGGWGHLPANLGALLWDAPSAPYAPIGARWSPSGRRCSVAAFCVGRCSADRWFWRGWSASLNGHSGQVRAQLEPVFPGWCHRRHGLLDRTSVTRTGTPPAGALASTPVAAMLSVQWPERCAYEAHDRDLGLEPDAAPVAATDRHRGERRGFWPTFVWGSVTQMLVAASRRGSFVTA
jgi:hypothetical protein